MDLIKDKALTMLQLLTNTGAKFEDEKLALGIIEETLKKESIAKLESIITAKINQRSKLNYEITHLRESIKLVEENTVPEI